MAERPIDWLRVGHRALSFLRAMRGDGETADADHRHESNRATELSRSLEDFARKQAGCIAPADCDCAICAGERTKS